MIAVIVVRRTPSSPPDILALRSLLFSENYSELNRDFEWYRKISLSDPAHEWYYYHALDAFSPSDEQISLALKKWSAKEPENVLPLLALVAHYTDWAWHARGGQLARDTSEKQFDGMKSYGQIANSYLQQAFTKKDTPLPMLYSMAFDLSRLLGASPQDLFVLIEKSHAACRSCTIPLQRAYWALSPHWLGSWDLLRMLNSKILEWEVTEPSMKRLRGWISYYRAFNAIREKQLDLALQYAEESIKEAFVVVYAEQKADILLRLNRPVEAEIELRAILKEYPQYPEALISLGSILSKRGQVEEGAALFAEAQKLDPENTKVRSTLTDAAFEKGNKLYERKQYLEALPYYQQVVTLTPDSAEGYYNIGISLLALGRYEDAKLPLLRAAALNDDDFKTYQMLDRCYSYQEDFFGAVTLWNDFLTKHPDHSGALFERAGSYRHAGKPDEALRDARKACALGLAEACQVIPHQ